MVDNVGARKAFASSEDNLLREANLLFTHDGATDSYIVRAWGDNDVFPNTGIQYIGRLLLPEADLYAAVTECRQVWQREVIARRDQEGRYPFAEGWNLGDRPDHLAEAGPRLAAAGERLFK